jgi:predicted nucleic acid-binding protein
VIFVDTGAWFAALVPNDADHEAADAWLELNTGPLVTTDYIVDGLLTLLRVRGEYDRALDVGPNLLRGEIARLEWVRQEDVEKAWEVFAQYQDKAWSFTDCVSRVIIERLGIETAFAFDEHFRQFGLVTVVPLRT